MTKEWSPPTPERFVRSLLISLSVTAAGLSLWLWHQSFASGPREFDILFVLNGAFLIAVGYAFLLSYKRRDNPLLRMLGRVSDSAFNIPGPVSALFVFGACLGIGVGTMLIGFGWVPK